MSENSAGEGDWGERDLDPHERAEAQVNLDDPSAGDDEPWSPPDRQPRGAELIGAETEGGESLGQRIMQEVPEEGTAYGAPGQDRAEEMVGGDDPDAIPADQDVLGGEPGHDSHVEDAEGPESGAMHLVEDDLP